jgi:hypothetical protein
LELEEGRGNGDEAGERFRRATFVVLREIIFPRLRIRCDSRFRSVIIVVLALVIKGRYIVAQLGCVYGIGADHGLLLASDGARGIGAKDIFQHNLGHIAITDL